jgi:hypothetical protein
MLVFCVASLTSASAQEVTPQTNLEAELVFQYSSVRRDHWAYDALFVLRQVKLNGVSLIERRNFYGIKDEAEMSRYEFSVVIARILGKFRTPNNFDAANFSSDSPLVTLADAKDALASLKKEFAFETWLLGLRSEDYPGARRRGNAPPRIILTPDMLKRLSTGKYTTQPKEPNSSTLK